MPSVYKVVTAIKIFILYIQIVPACCGENSNYGTVYNIEDMAAIYLPTTDKWNRAGKKNLKLMNIIPENILLNLVSSIDYELFKLPIKNECIYSVFKLVVAKHRQNPKFEYESKEIQSVYLIIKTLSSNILKKLDKFNIPGFILSLATMKNLEYDPEFVERSFYTWNPESIFNFPTMANNIKLQPSNILSETTADILLAIIFYRLQGVECIPETSVAYNSINHLIIGQIPSPEIKRLLQNILTGPSLRTEKYVIEILNFYSIYDKALKILDIFKEKMLYLAISKYPFTSDIVSMYLADKIRYTLIESHPDLVPLQIAISSYFETLKYKLNIKFNNSDTTDIACDCITFMATAYHSKANKGYYKPQSLRFQNRQLDAVDYIINTIRNSKISLDLLVNRIDISIRDLFNTMSFIVISKTTRNSCMRIVAHIAFKSTNWIVVNSAIDYIADFICASDAITSNTVDEVVCNCDSIDSKCSYKFDSKKYLSEFPFIWLLLKNSHNATAINDIINTVNIDITQPNIGNTDPDTIFLIKSSKARIQLITFLLNTYCLKKQNISTFMEECYGIQLWVNLLRYFNIKSEVINYLNINNNKMGQIVLDYICSGYSMAISYILKKYSII